MTTSDFCQLLTRHDRIDAELADRLGRFLRACDERKFAPASHQPPLGAAGLALELIDAAEARRTAIPVAAPSTRPA